MRRVSLQLRLNASALGPTAPPLSPLRAVAAVAYGTQARMFATRRWRASSAVVPPHRRGRPALGSLLQAMLPTSSARAMFDADVDAVLDTLWQRAPEERLQASELAELLPDAVYARVQQRPALFIAMLESQPTKFRVERDASTSTDAHVIILGFHAEEDSGDSHHSSSSVVGDDASGPGVVVPPGASLRHRRGEADMDIVPAAISQGVPGLSVPVIQQVTAPRKLPDEPEPGTVFPASADTTGTVSPAKGIPSPIFACLLPLMPGAFFIPLVVLAAEMTADSKEAIAAAFGPGIDGVFAAVNALSNKEVDVRVLGETVDDVYIRAIAEDVPCDLDLEAGDEYFAEGFDVSSLASPLHAALLRQGPVPVDALPDALGQELYESLPLKGPAAILVFDRLQYAFDVNLHDYRVTAKEVADPGPTGLSMRTTPDPRLLRYFLTHLTHPTCLHTVERELPDPIYSSLATHFGDIGHFVAMHPVHFFVRDRTILWSTILHRKYAKRATPSASSSTTSTTSDGGVDGADSAAEDVYQREVAELIAAALPVDRAIAFPSLRAMTPREHKNIFTKKPRDWFAKFPHLFATYNLLGISRFVIQRPELPAPRNSLPPARTEEDVKLIAAMLLVEPATFDVFTTYLPVDAKKKMSRRGGPQKWLERNQHLFLFDGSRWRYVGHLTMDEREQLTEDLRQQHHMLQHEQQMLEQSRQFQNRAAASSSHHEHHQYYHPSGGDDSYGGGRHDRDDERAGF